MPSKNLYFLRLISSTALVCILCGFLGVLWANSHRRESGTKIAASTRPATQSRPNLPEATRIRLMESYGKLPLSFEANRGQTDGRVKFVSRGSGCTLFLTANEAILKLQRSRVGTSAVRHIDNQLVADEPPRFLHMKLVGANPSPAVAGLEELPGKSNYFIGNDPKQWRTDVPNYAKVQYRQTYPGVDLIYYGNQRQLEYDFVVAPAADPRVITLDLAADSPSRDGQPDGAHGNTLPQIAEDGNLVLTLAGSELRFKKPVIYQQDETAKRFVDGRWILKGGSQVGFEVGAYDTTKSLVIDPAVSYSTFLGGSLDNSGYNVAADSAGNAYVTGNTSSADFPTKNPYQAALNGTTDAFVVKLNSTGTQLIYSTYLGGKGEEFSFWVTVSAGGNAYVVGSTGSSDYPTTTGAFQTTCGGGCAAATRDAFVTELNAKGSTLVYSTYLGGSGSDQANDIQLDSTGNAYIAGWTNSSDFPTTPGAFQTTYSGTTNAFVTKLNPTGTASVYSTLLGTSNENRAFGIVVRSAGDCYITGFTSSTAYPTTAGAFQTTLRGASNAFVTHINSTGSALLYSTYLGGSGNDIAWGIAMDQSNNAYVAGQTSSPDFPTTAGALRTTCSAACSSNDIFVSKLDPTGSTLGYSTYLGGSSEQEAYSIAADSAGNAYVTGRTKSADFPTTPGAFRTANSGVLDSFLTELNPTGSSPKYSTYFGGSMTETGLGIALDSSGNVYVVGRTYSTDFPITPRAVQRNFAGKTQAFVAKFVIGDQAWPLAISFGTESIGVTTAPLTTILTNSEATPLSITSVTIGGSSPGDYAQTNDCGTSVAPGAFCTISVTFTPLAATIRNATLSITDSAANSPQNVTLTGTGTAKAASLTPASITFPNQVVGSSSPAHTATLTNTGTAVLNITGITATGPYSQTSTCGSTLAPGAKCKINVVFSPTGSGTLTGSLTVTDDAPGSPRTVSLSGTGTFMSFSPTSLNFGNQATGTSSAPQNITMTNVGTSSVAISKIGITGLRASSFSQTNNCGASLAAGASCTLSVVFTPQLLGAINASVSVADTGGGSPQTVRLSGTGI